MSPRPSFAVGSFPDAASSTPLLHRVDRALQRSPHLVGRNLVLETRDGAVLLRGTVDSYFEKQMAQEALRSVEGITEILNQLEVAYATI
jgi:osmotically-inducible protein OsmY